MYLQIHNGRCILFHDRTKSAIKPAIYSVIRILKFLSKHCKFKFFFFFFCYFSAWHKCFCVVFPTSCVSLVSIFSRGCQISACYMLMHPIYVCRGYTANISICERDRWMKEITLYRRWIFEIGDAKSKTQFFLFLPFRFAKHI